LAQKVTGNAVLASVSRELASTTSGLVNIADHSTENFQQPMQ